MATGYVPSFTHNSHLGNTQYVNSIPSSIMNVVFKPQTDNSTVDYNTLVLEDDEVYEIEKTDSPSNPSFISSTIITNKPENKTCKNDPYSIGDNKIVKFYIGSVTVIGLFILFRIMQKTK